MTLLMLLTYAIMITRTYERICKPVMANAQARAGIQHWDVATCWMAIDAIVMSLLLLPSSPMSLPSLGLSNWQIACVLMILSLGKCGALYSVYPIPPSPRHRPEGLVVLLFLQLLHLAMVATLSFAHALLVYGLCTPVVMLAYGYTMMIAPSERPTTAETNASIKPPSINPPYKQCGLMMAISLVGYFALHPLLINSSLGSDESLEIWGAMAVEDWRQVSMF